MQRLELTKNEKRCKLCEEGEVHEECTIVQKTDEKYVCDKCDYTSDKIMNVKLHNKTVDAVDVIMQHMEDKL